MNDRIIVAFMVVACGIIMLFQQAIHDLEQRTKSTRDVLADHLTADHGYSVEDLRNLK